MYKKELNKWRRIRVLVINKMSQFLKCLFLSRFSWMLSTDVRYQRPQWRCRLLSAHTGLPGNSVANDDIDNSGWHWDSYKACLFFFIVMLYVSEVISLEATSTKMFLRYYFIIIFFFIKCFKKFLLLFKGKRL